MTGFATEYGGAGTQTLESVFAAGVTGGLTGFVATDGQDLAARFAPLADGARIAFNSGFVALDGRDLREWFCAAGTAAVPWPVNGGFTIGRTGENLPVASGQAAYFGKLTWQTVVAGVDYVEGPLNNVIADFLSPCPVGLGRANADSWADHAPYVRGQRWGLPNGARLRFEVYTDNLGGATVRDIVVAPGVQTVDWFAVHTGAIAFCGGTADKVDMSMNASGFAPAPGSYYGAASAYLSWGSAGSYTLKFSAGFGINAGSLELNVVKLKIWRVS